MRKDIGYYIVSRDKERCFLCNTCTDLVNCPADEDSGCIGCGACVLSCPSEARKLVERPREDEVRVRVRIDGRVFQVPGRITVRTALVLTGHRNAVSPEEPGLSTACGIGGCWSCAVEVDGVVRPACHTAIREGMSIKTELPKEYVPERRVMFFSGQAGIPQIEAVCFTVGCNFMCPQCNNSFITYNGRAEALTPQEAARRLTRTKEAIRANRTMITGGESTLNRAWLIQYIMELRKLNPAPQTRFLVDTNGSLLTHGYIDDLVDAGVTDIGIDLKGLNPDVFMLITGLEDRNLAERYKETAWEATNYLAHRYRGRVSLSVSIPYNKALMSLKELRRIGIRLFKIDRSIPAGVISYNGAFRKRDLPLPGYKEMKKAHAILKEVGLGNVVAKTPEGFIQHSGTLLRTQGPY